MNYRETISGVLVLAALLLSLIALFTVLER
jgi:hypothetical protein